MTTPGAPPERVEGLDLLRGLCALGVVTYHLLSWTRLASLYNLGLYGVYLFFTLSGASLALAYTARFRAGYSLRHFYALRYARLAPLYAAATTCAAVGAALTSGVSTSLLTKWLLNVTLAFGLANPGETALVTGGWSLGIEFCFYLLFPALVSLSGTRALALAAAGGLVVQTVFGNWVLQGHDLGESWVRYTQPAAFIGYFCAGVWVGCRHVGRRSLPWPGARVAGIAFVGLIALLATGHGHTASDSLTGYRGVLCTAASLVVVALAVRLSLPQWFRPLAQWLGDCSYSLYIIHPIVFSLLRSRHLLGGLYSASPVLFVALTLTVALVASTLIYRLFERPILSWAKNHLRGAPPGGA